jgi:hypothetical protein
MHKVFLYVNLITFASDMLQLPSMGVSDVWVNLSTDSLKTVYFCIYHQIHLSYVPFRQVYHDTCIILICIFPHLCRYMTK